MPVFSWEQNIIEVARTWPQSGPLFTFMHSISDLSVTIYFILAGLAIMTWRLGWKAIVGPTIFSLLALLFAEISSRRIIKALVMRPRPDYLGMDCHMSACWGFISSHATNVFAVAIFLTLYNRRNGYWALPIAALVSFSRIYLADHYPLDVAGGILVGALLGVMVWIIYKKFAGSRLRKLSQSVRT